MAENAAFRLIWFSVLPIKTKSQITNYNLFYEITNLAPKLNHNSQMSQTHIPKTRLPTYTGKGFLLTINNPSTTAQELLEDFKTQGALCGSVALEKGASGTVHL